MLFPARNAPCVIGKLMHNRWARTRESDKLCGKRGSIRYCSDAYVLRQMMGGEACGETRAVPVRGGCRHGGSTAGTDMIDERRPHKRKVLYC
jgi:hypothetical protein